MCFPAPLRETSGWFERMALWTRLTLWRWIHLVVERAAKGRTPTDGYKKRGDDLSGADRTGRDPPREFDSRRSLHREHTNTSREEPPAK
jgi:hypothetical protein